MYAGVDEEQDGAQYETGRQQAAEVLHLLVVHTRNGREQCSHEDGDGAEHDEDVLLKQVDALVQRHGQQADNGRTHRGQQQRDEYVGRVGSAELGAVGHDADGDDGQT